ncbi:hypothetical protein GCM10010525_03770 [Glutamicibacter bergerei]
MDGLVSVAAGAGEVIDDSTRKASVVLQALVPKISNRTQNIPIACRKLTRIPFRLSAVGASRGPTLPIMPGAIGE